MNWDSDRDSSDENDTVPDDVRSTTSESTVTKKARKKSSESDRRHRLPASKSAIDIKYHAIHPTATPLLHSTYIARKRRPVKRIGSENDTVRARSAKRTRATRTNSNQSEGETRRRGKRSAGHHGDKKSHTRRDKSGTPVRERKKRPSTSSLKSTSDS